MINERIQELVKLTDGQFYEGFAGSTNFVKFAEDDLQKFAELIVQECINKIEIEASQYAEPVWAFELINDIREHFGAVE